MVTLSTPYIVRRCSGLSQSASTSYRLREFGLLCGRMVGLTVMRRAGQKGTLGGHCTGTNGTVYRMSRDRVHKAVHFAGLLTQNATSSADPWSIWPKSVPYSSLKLQLSYGEVDQPNASASRRYGGLRFGACWVAGPFRTQQNSIYRVM